MCYSSIATVKRQRSGDKGNESPDWGMGLPIFCGGCRLSKLILKEAQ